MESGEGASGLRARGPRKLPDRWRGWLMGGLALVELVAALLYGHAVYSLWVPPPTLTDDQVHHAISYAYMQGDNLWVSFHGAAPRIVTRLQFHANEPDWRIIWSESGSKLLVTGIEEHWFLGPGSVDVDGGAQSVAFLVSLPGGAATAPRDVPTNCAHNTCLWLGDRYIIHERDPLGFSPSQFRVYDTQAQRDLVTRLDTQNPINVEVRDSAVYFSPLPQVNGEGCSTGTIQRFDLASNTINKAFDLPSPLLDRYAITSQWDVSGDGSHALVITGSVAPSDNSCPQIPQARMYLLSQGATSTIASSEFSSDAAISNDGRYAAFGASPNSSPDGATPTLTQFNASTGAWLNHAIYPARAGLGEDSLNYAILGWVGEDAGFLITQTQCMPPPMSETQRLPLNLQPLVATVVYYAPAGSPSPARVIEAIHGPLAVFFALPQIAGSRVYQRCQ